MSTEASRRCRARWDAAGRCTRCGGERDRTDRTRCQRCRAKKREENRRNTPTPEKRLAYERGLRRRRLASGMCAICGRHRLAEGSFSGCESCLERQRAWTKARRDRRRAQGLCQRCGKPAVPGMSICAGCRGGAA